MTFRENNVAPRELTRVPKIGDINWEAEASKEIYIEKQI